MISQLRRMARSLRRASFVGAAAAFALTSNGCAARNSVGFPCPAIVELPPRLFVPAPQATGVPVDIGRIIVGSPADGTFTLRAGAGVISLGPVVPVPTPLPSGVPTQGGPYNAVLAPELARDTTYLVNYDAVPGPPPCGSGESGGTIGSFTTAR